jgi:hypothetical protein
LVFLLSEGQAGEGCDTSNKNNALSNIGGVLEKCFHIFLGNDVASPGNRVQTFRKNVLPSSSGSTGQLDDENSLQKKKLLNLFTLLTGF